MLKTKKVRKEEGQAALEYVIVTAQVVIILAAVLFIGNQTMKVALQDYYEFVVRLICLPIP